MVWRAFTVSLLSICIFGVCQTAVQQSQETPDPGTVVLDTQGFEMVYVPTGSFEMGVGREEFRDFIEDGGLGDVSDSAISFFEDEAAYEGVFDTYTATVHAFWIDRYEVTI
ncbi:MAG: hypothetical protein J0M07_25695, partial [Anaerolineae bacterium]|nr:hypothetical protein [Anaerolineae bacterium]